MKSDPGPVSYTHLDVYKRQVRRIPQIFGVNTLYATCAVAASVVVVIFNHYGHAPMGTIVATCVGGALRLLAQWRGWQLRPGLGTPPDEN